PGGARRGGRLRHPRGGLPQHPGVPRARARGAGGDRGPRRPWRHPRLALAAPARLPFRAGLTGACPPSMPPRLPPGQILTTKLPVLHFGAVPRVDLARWRFRVWGAVARPFNLGWDELLTLP